MNAKEFFNIIFYFIMLLLHGKIKNNIIFLCEGVVNESFDEKFNFNIRGMDNGTCYRFR